MVVPNGTGGLLVASETDDAQNPVWIKNIPQPSVSGAGTEIHIASLNTINNLVIGENGNAFAAGSFNFFETPRLVSFNLASGAPNWTYDSTFHTDSDPGYVDIVAAARTIRSMRWREGSSTSSRKWLSLWMQMGLGPMTQPVART